MLLVGISKVEIEISQGGGPSITQCDDMLNDCRADRGYQPLRMRRELSNEPNDALS